MAYIYKKIVHGKPYYYLRISKRIGGRVVPKDVAFLGDSIENLEKELDNLDKYQKEIRKGYKTIRKFTRFEHYLLKIQKQKLRTDPYFRREILEQLEAIKLHYQNTFHKLDGLTKHDVLKHFVIDFAHNTTAIEGNTITLKQAHKLLTEELLPKNKKLREIYDLQNTERVFLWLFEENPPLHELLLIDIHDKLMENIDSRTGYKVHDNRVFRATFESTPAKYVKADMGIFWDEYKKVSRTLHPFALAVIMHHKMEKIHPFADGNGRTGRMLLNYVLQVHEWPPLIIRNRNRSEYLDAIAVADGADLITIDPKYYKRFIEYLAQEFIVSYWENFNV